MDIGISNMDATALGVNAVDLSTQGGADSAIGTIDGAITTVSTERAKLGAYQNPVSYTHLDVYKRQPLSDRLVVKVLEAEEKTASGIVLPDKAKEKPQEGEVMAVGPGKVLENGTRLEMDLKVGDKIIFSRYAGTEVKIKGEEYLILRQDDVLALVQ